MGDGSATIWGGKQQPQCLMYVLNQKTLTSLSVSLLYMRRREALGSEVVRWTAIVKEAADRQLASVVDGKKDMKEKEGGAGSS